MPEENAEKARAESSLVLRVSKTGKVVGMNESARSLLGDESLHMPCERVMRGISSSGKPICREGCAIAVAAQEEPENSATGVRVRKKTMSLRCQRVGDEVIVIAEPAPTPQASEQLTPREKQVLAMVGQGLSSSKIAHRLEITNATVRTHVEHALRRLGAKTRAEAVLRAVSTGQLPPPSRGKEQLPTD